MKSASGSCRNNQAPRRTRPRGGNLFRLLFQNLPLLCSRTPPADNLLIAASIRVSKARSIAIRAIFVCETRSSSSGQYLTEVRAAERKPTTARRTFTARQWDIFFFSTYNKWKYLDAFASLETLMTCGNVTPCTFTLIRLFFPLLHSPSSHPPVWASRRPGSHIHTFLRYRTRQETPHRKKNDRARIPLAATVTAFLRTRIYCRK